MGRYVKMELFILGVLLDSEYYLKIPIQAIRTLTVTQFLSSNSFSTGKKNFPNNFFQNTSRTALLFLKIYSKLLVVKFLHLGIL